MLRYSLVLLATIAIFSGCDDGECCGIERETAANVAPVAVVSGFAATCTAGETVNVSGSTSTDDSGVSSYTWTPASIVGENGTFTCPDSGSQEICLTVTDDDGLASTQECKTITVGAVVSTLQDPIIDLNAIYDGAGDGFSIECPQIKDQDAINTDGIDNVYGTDKAIKEIHWKVTYPDATETIWTQTDWNNDVADDAYIAGTCGKWVGGHGFGEVVIDATPVDDEDNNKTYTFTFDIQDGSVTKQ